MVGWGLGVGGGGEEVQGGDDWGVVVHRTSLWSGDSIDAPLLGFIHREAALSRFSILLEYGLLFMLRKRT